MRAGAGAGKTTNLIGEVYSFYKSYKKEHGRDPRVVLTTFTRKATQELRERLMLTGQVKQDYEFLNFILSPNNLLISTIHGVLQLFLRQFARLIDLDPGFKIVDDSILKKQTRIFIRELLIKNDQTQILLDELTIGELSQALQEYYELKLRYENISTFHKSDLEKAKKEWVQEIYNQTVEVSKRLTEEAITEKWIEYAASLKRLAQEIKDAQSGQDLLFAVQLFSSIRKPNYSAKNPSISKQLDNEIQNFRKDLKKIEPFYVDESLWDKAVDYHQIFERFAEEYFKKILKWKKENGQITISDLELFSLKIMREFPEKTLFFSDTFDYWLIDEFQDTSPLQVELLEAMSTNKPRYIVGDPQQSIYFFRGARRQVFEESEKSIQSSGGRFENLIRNYRSDKALMSFINYFFLHYSHDFMSMDLGPKEGFHKNVFKISLAQSEEEQANAILQRIEECIALGTDLNQICILARKNSQLKKIALILDKAKIPHILHAASGFQNRREILDAISFLKFLINPHDNYNLLTILRSPWFRVLDPDIIAIAEQKPTSYWMQFLKSKDDKKYISISRLQQYLVATFEIGITRTFEKMLVDSGMIDHSYRFDRSGRRESNVWKLLVQLKTEDHHPDFSYAKFIQQNGEIIELDDGSEDSDALSALEPNCVQLMTVHMSKGLEFDHVIIPFVDKPPTTNHFKKFLTAENKWVVLIKMDEEKGVKPLFIKKSLDLMKEEEALENHRLLYVAMTRAKKTLMFSTSGELKENSQADKEENEERTWYKNIGIPLQEGIHKTEDFEYLVEAGPWMPRTFHESQKESFLVSNPLFDLAKFKKEKLESVTQSLDKKYQTIDFHTTIKKAHYGTQAHKVFESMKYGRQISQDLVLAEAQEYLKNLKEIPILQILEKGYAEWGYSMTDPNTLQTLSGQIDLWALIEGHLWIIDYKTGSSIHQDAAFEQLKKYAEALRHYVQTQSVTLVALYPLEKRCILKDLKMAF